MKSPWWPAWAVAWLGLTFPGVRAPATFYIKHTSTDDKGLPQLSPSAPPTSFSSVTTYPVRKGGSNSVKPGFEPRLYPGTTYNEDFGNYPGDNSLTTGFDFTDFNSQPGEISPTAPDKSREDYGPTGYNVESGEPPDYQTFYSSDEEEQPSPPPSTSDDEHRDYNNDDDDDDEESPVNYEVEEKIPDDLKYKPPKVKVYPMPPPCKGATPPPWPTNPPPPKPTRKKPKPRPKPKPKPGGSGYYRYAANPVQHTTTRAAKYRPTGSARYRTSVSKPRLVYQNQPYIIRYSGVGNRPILIRHRTVRPISQSTKVYRASKKQPNKPKEIIKEVHIHHHHNPPIHPIPPIPHPIPIVPLIPLLDENGFPLHRSDPANRKPYSVHMTSSGSDNLANFSPFGMTPSGSDNVALVAVAPSPPTGSDNLATVGRFAEPLPTMTSSFRASDAVNASAINSQSVSKIHAGA